MTNDLTIPANQPALPNLSRELVERMADLAAAAASANTRRGYASDLEHFETWAAGQGAVAMPAHPALVGGYLAAHAGLLSVATLERRLAALSSAHRHAGHQLDTRHPMIANIFSGIKNTYGVAQKKVAAATTDIVEAMVATCEDDVIGVRDRAMLLLGFAGAFRRSELVELEVSDLSFTAEGLIVKLRRSKTDQEGKGRTIAIKPATVISAVQAWLLRAGIASGPVFRGVNRHSTVGETMIRTNTVAETVKKRATMAGLDASQFSGHSLRAGFVTSASAAGASDRAIAATTGHRDLRTLNDYDRPASVWSANASDTLGL